MQFEAPNQADSTQHPVSFLYLKSKIKDYSANTSQDCDLTIPYHSDIRPKPVEENIPLNTNDNILLDLFEILYHQTEVNKGVTVKQLCNKLILTRKDLANQSAKLSNLVSAKLNAYIKRQEKGQLQLYYALDRWWSVTSPKRMLYAYVGTLASNYQNYTIVAIQRHMMQVCQSQQQLQPSMQFAQPPSPLLTSSTATDSSGTSATSYSSTSESAEAAQSSPKKLDSNTQENNDSFPMNIGLQRPRTPELRVIDPFPAVEADVNAEPAGPEINTEDQLYGWKNSPVVVSPARDVSRWLESDFLYSEIESPENVSLDELERQLKS